MNTLTHAAGVVVAAVFAIAFLWRGGANWSLFVFALSMAVLYASSALYHGLKVSPRAIGRLQRLDHGAIFVLIAGTYTPVLWLGLPDPWRWISLSVIWGITLLGLGLKAWTVLPDWLSLTLYIVQGWLILAVLPMLLRVLPASAFAAMVAGGVLYTAGVPFFASRRRWRFWGFGTHEVWHLFVLAGSVAHGIMVWNLPHF